MRTKTIAMIGSVLVAAYAPLAVAATAQITPSQMKADSSHPDPAVADASIAKRAAGVAKQNALAAKKAATTPKAKAAADAAAKNADVATRAAAAASKTVSKR